MNPKEWQAVRELVKQANHVSVATVGPAGQPHVSPIGSYSLHPAEPRGYWLEKFPSNLPRHLEADQRVQIMAVQGGGEGYHHRGDCAGSFGLHVAPNVI